MISLRRKVFGGVWGRRWSLLALLLLALTFKARLNAVEVKMDDPIADPQAAQIKAFLSEDPVIRRALGLLPPMTNPVIGRKRTDLHPLVQKTLGQNVGAFHTPGNSELTVLSDSPMYTAASNEQDRLAQYLLAGAILHEKTHEQSPQELLPYQAELKFMQGYVPSNDQDRDKWKGSLQQIKGLLRQAEQGKIGKK